jgi:protein-S-isoprenylcysteine O-methyltransferase Ste14
VVWGLAVGWLAWIAIMPLDARRFGWSAGFPLWLQVVGGLLLVPAFVLFYRAFTDNPYLSALVRVQSERRQHVVSTGVYGFVRHPMYLGAILMFLGAPALMGSKYGLLIGLVLSLLLAGRSLGEEKLLVDELEGYEEYRKKVRYRLIPFVW